MNFSTFTSFSTLSIWFLPLVIGISSFFTMMIVRNWVFKILKEIKNKTGFEIYENILQIIKFPSIFWIIAFSFQLAIFFSELPNKYIAFVSKVVYVLIIFSFTYTIANLIEHIIKNYVHKLDLPISPTGIVYWLIKGVIFIIGFLIILSFLDISVVPIITSLGIGGLAVALALQDTLSNLFAGIHILAEKSIRVGDFVKLENGQEGYIEEIGWRTTKIKTLSNNLIIIPNNKLAQSIITNYYLPNKKMSLLIPINVSYSEDPDKIEKIVLDEVNKAIGQVKGLLNDPAPTIRFIPGFGENSLNFTLVCHINEFTNQFFVQHELRKRIFKRFKEEGIEIPFPQRVVHIKKE